MKLPGAVYLVPAGVLHGPNDPSYMRVACFQSLGG